MAMQMFRRESRIESYDKFRDSLRHEDTSYLMGRLTRIEVGRRRFGFIGKISKYFKGPQEQAMRDTLLERLVYKKVYHNNTPKETFLDRDISEKADYYGWERSNE